jgi:dTDP-glucose 4,6-dehydratase
MTEKYPRYNFVCVDALTYAGNYHTVKPLVDAKKLKFYRADIADRAKMREIFKTEGFDIVVNFAAESHVDKSISNPEIFLKTNILGTQILMDCCREFNVARFHQISTDEVYGDLPLDRRDLFFTEHTPPRPSSPYSASKASADLLALAYYRTYGFPLTISRCSNNYGPFHFPEKLIPLMIIKASYGEKLPIYGKGSNVRDWLYVTDHCSAIDLVIHKGKTGEVYNVGGHNEKSNLEVVKIILAELGKDEELISYTPDRLGHDLRYAVDPTKITNELGWTPKIAFDEGIKKTIRWYLDNKRWWQEILSGEYKNPLEFPYTIRSAQ